MTEPASPSLPHRTVGTTVRKVLLPFLIPFVAGVAAAILLSADNVVGFILYILVGALVGTLLGYLAIRPRLSRSAEAPTNDVSALTVSAFVLAFIIPLAGAILAHVALGQIDRRQERGRALARAAAIIGWVATALWLIALIFIIVIAILART